ncbi:hypothetical protein [Pedobacter sp. ASV28]|uniref:hypothetical protein n=1 Tax=Pedobacter sp. ASV28 TaxID=2795123 RepID=UPI0018EACEEB|nr:hypothetical protein [Pedobacter sp. ASV28]
MKKIKLPLFLMFFAVLFSCKKEQASFETIKTDAAKEKKMNGPECPDCDLIIDWVPEGGGHASFDCNAGTGVWDMNNTVRVYISYERQNGLLVIKSLGAGKSPLYTGPSTTSTHVYTPIYSQINQTDGLITATISGYTKIRMPGEPASSPNAWMYENFVYSIIIDTCNQTGFCG